VHLTVSLLLPTACHMPHLRCWGQDEVLALLPNFESSHLCHVLRAGNAMADSLANEAPARTTSHPVPLGPLGKPRGATIEDASCCLP
jgi:hypothetical protein